MLVPLTRNTARRRRRLPLAAAAVGTTLEPSKEDHPQCAEQEAERYQQADLEYPFRRRLTRHQCTNRSSILVKELARPESWRTWGTSRICQSLFVTR
jgi:hypothetical protein